MTAALAWAAQDVPVFPLFSVADGICDCREGSECRSPGKHPLARLVPHGVKDATTDPVGPEVRRVVEEVTDDKRLPKAERKRLQIEHAPHLSARAKQIKLADKVSNVRAVTRTPPADWPLTRRREYRT